MNTIRAEHICKSFEGREILRDVSFTLPAGEITCLTGPSGSGKTTLLNILAGLERPDAGSVSGVPERISFVFQEDRLTEEFRAVSCVRFAVGKKMSEKEILSHLREVGLSNDLDKSVSRFSGGMKRRLAVVRAVCFGGDFLIMDEPFKGLDELMKDVVISYVKRHTAGKTLLVVTHDPKEAEALGGRVLDLSSLNHCLPKQC